MKLIDKDKVVEEIKRRLEVLANTSAGNNREFAAIIGAQHYELINLAKYINTLEVKEVKENKLPNPRFPHLDNIIEKVFGAGNLESFEYEEAEQLVLLAKEELLKDLDGLG